MGDVKNYFGVYSPQLWLGDATSSDSTKWPLLTPGTPIKLTALLPPAGTSLPTAGTGTFVGYDVPAKLKWKVSVYDYDRSGDAAFAPAANSGNSGNNNNDSDARPPAGGEPSPGPGAPTGGSSSGGGVTWAASPFPNTQIQPSSTIEDLSGCYQLLSGDLFSESLSILPWPEPGSGLSSLTPSQFLRAFRIQLELTLLFPRNGTVTYNVPNALFGIVDSWKSLFPWKTSPTDSSNELQAPNGDSFPTAGSVDPLASFRNLFNVVVDNSSPDLSQPSSILVAPSDAVSKITSSVTEIVDDGSSLVEHIKPSASTPFPSVTTVPGSSRVVGNVPIGSLNIPFQLASKDIEVRPDPLSSANYVVRNLNDRLGKSLLPMPVLTSPGSTAKPASIVQVRIPLDLKIPGRRDPLHVYLTPTKFATVQAPTIQVPQVALFFRSFIKDFTSGDYTGDVLVVTDPETRKAYPGLGFVRKAIENLATDLSKLLQLFPSDRFSSYLPVGMYSQVTDLIAAAVSAMYFLDDPGSRVFDGYPTDSTASTIDLAKMTPPFYEYNSAKNYALGRNLSSMLWMGLPGTKNRYQMTIPMSGGPPGNQVSGTFYIPIPSSSVTSMLWDASLTPPPGVGFVQTSGTSIRSKTSSAPNGDISGNDENPTEPSQRQSNGTQKEMATAATTATATDPVVVIDKTRPAWSDLLQQIVWQLRA